MTENKNSATFSGPALAFFGECMIELQGAPLSPMTQAFAGDVLNTAVYFARMTRDQQITTSFFSAVGNDPFSEAMLAQWRSEGIDCSGVLRVADHQPGIYYIEVDEQGERSFYYWRNDSAARYVLQQDAVERVLQRLMDYRGFYLSGISLAILPAADRQRLFEWLAKYKASGGQCWFDNNYRPRLWASKQEAQAAYRQCLAHCHGAMLTLDDEIDLYGEDDVETVIARHQALGVQEIVIKRGAQSCIVACNEERVEVAPTPVAKVRDTTAAGDSFGAGYLAARFCGRDVASAARAGHQLAGTVIQYPGAIIPEDAMPALPAA